VGDPLDHHAGGVLGAQGDLRRHRLERPERDGQIHGRNARKVPKGLRFRFLRSGNALGKLLRNVG